MQSTGKPSAALQCVIQRLAIIPTFQEKLDKLLDNFPGYIYTDQLPELYKKEILKLVDEITTYLTTQYAAELLNDKQSLYREKRDEWFKERPFPGSMQLPQKVTIAQWVSQKVWDEMSIRRDPPPRFMDEVIWCNAIVTHLLEAYKIVNRCKMEEEKRMADAAAAKAKADAEAASLAEAHRKRAAAEAQAKANAAAAKAAADAEAYKKVAAAQAEAAAAKAAAQAERTRLYREKQAKFHEEIKEMEEDFEERLTDSLKLRYFPEQAKWLPDFDMTLLQDFKEAKEEFMEEHEEEVKKFYSRLCSEQTLLERAREATRDAVKALLAPRGAILTLTDMAVGGVSQIFDLRGTDGALMAWGSGTAQWRDVKLVLQCSLNEKTENFLDTTYHLPISTPETYATLNERLPAAPFVRFVVRGGALSHVNVKVSFK